MVCDPVKFAYRKFPLLATPSPDDALSVLEAGKVPVAVRVEIEIPATSLVPASEMKTQSWLELCSTLTRRVAVEPIPSIPVPPVFTTAASLSKPLCIMVKKVAELPDKEVLNEVSLLVIR